MPASLLHPRAPRYREQVAAALLFVGVAGIVSAQGEGGRAAAGLPDLAAIDAYVEAEMRADRVPGAALAIVRGAETVHLRGYGEDGNGKPVTPQTAFILGSMSKAFTALLVMQLVDQGKLSLDAPVQRYLPWFTVADPVASARITVRHLLNQTSGLPGDAHHASGRPTGIEDHVRALSDVRLAHPPGSVHEYSSPNYLVLGALVQQVGGQTYAEQVQRGIFTPLGMRHSFTSQATALQSSMARGHRYWFGYPQPTVLDYEEDRMPTAALISSAEDIGRFLVAQLEGQLGGVRVLWPAGMAEMHRPAAPSEGFSYAMGWRVGVVRGVPAIHHGGIVPHFRGKMVMLPEGRWGVAVLTNVSSVLPVSPTSHRMADNIAALLAGQPLPAPGSRLRQIQLVIGLAIALISFNQLKGAFRLGRWRSALSGRTRLAARLDVGLELVMPVVVLLGVPRLMGLPLAAVIRSAPDIGYWLVASATLGMAVGLYKLGVVWRHVPADSGRAS